MKQYTPEQIKNIYAARRARIAAYLTENNIGAAVYIDSEEHREPAIPYLTVHNSDAIVIIFSDGFTYLIAWDEILAKKIGYYDKLVPYTRYKNKDTDAVRAILNVGYTHGVNSKVELPPYLTYPQYIHFIDTLNNYDCRCREDGVHKFTVDCRVCKDEYEIECTREAARIGDLIIDKIETGIKDGSIKTEMDVALFIERECREYGCERTGFDTLAAGPERSFAIHAFPGYTKAPWPAKGLSILDFGVVYKGYTSDTTVTVAKGRLTPEQKKQLALVQKAYDECLKLYKPGKPIQDAAKRGIVSSGGLPMLVGQARRSAELFLHQSISDECMADVLSTITREITNIVLIGMPGCGKTTIGKELAELLHRPFYDCDQEIERISGMTVPQLFASKGESVFRDYETSALRNLCAMHGIVLATGGGCVTRPENRRLLRQNGFCVYLQAPLDALELKGRPLSKDRYTVLRLFNQRHPIYDNWADDRLERNAQPKQTAEELAKRFIRFCSGQQKSD